MGYVENYCAGTWLGVELVLNYGSNLHAPGTSFVASWDTILPCCIMGYHLALLHPGMSPSHVASWDITLPCCIMGYHL